jgi:O-antigen/teichoic acid export membrane protein
MERVRVTPASPVKNVLWNWGALAFSIAVTLVLSPYIVRRLGDTAYGLWVLLGSLVGYLGLLDFGIRGAVTRYVAKLHAAAADAEASRITSTAATIVSIAAVVAVVGSVVLATSIVQNFDITPAETVTARIVVILGGLTIAATLLGGVFGGIVIGVQRFDLNGQIEIGVGIVRALGIYIALRVGFGLVALAVIQLAVSVARTGASAWLAGRLYPTLRLRFGVWEREALRELVSFSLYSTLLVFSSTLILYSDSVVIGALLPVQAITFFAIASNLTSYARALIGGLSSTLGPRASALEVQGGDQIRQVTLRASRIATLLILPIALTFLLRGEAFIGLWMGARYAETSGEILRILTYGLVGWTTGQVTLYAVIGVNRHKGLVPFYIAEAVINLGLSLLWVRQMGLPGAAWGTTVPTLVSWLLVMPWYARRTLGIPLRDYWTQIWLRPLVAMIPFAVGTAVIDAYWPAQNLVSYFAGVTALLPLAVAGAWAVALEPPERERLRLWSTILRRREPTWPVTRPATQPDVARPGAPP